MTRTVLRVTGTVQGVGFRPSCTATPSRSAWLASSSTTRPACSSTSRAVTEQIAELTRLLVDDAPPLAAWPRSSPNRRPPAGGASGFRIVDSRPAGRAGRPGEHRQRHLRRLPGRGRRPGRPPPSATRSPTAPNCGPRYTIVLSVPYDRPATTMAGFTMCPACQAEYDDPADRRFHAQPNACPVCGPQLAWRDRTGAVIAEGPARWPRRRTRSAQGRSSRSKGIGGYHLAVDATDAAAVRRAAPAQGRDDKPFAVMVADLDGGRPAVRRSTRRRRAALTSTAPSDRPRAPPSRRRRRSRGGARPARTSALLLPYSPLHHLLLADVGRPLVMTSGNLSDEPIAHDDDDAAAGWAAWSTASLHPRPADPHPLRRLRGAGRRRPAAGAASVPGYAPEPLALPFTAAPCRARRRRRAARARSACAKG